MIELLIAPIIDNGYVCYGVVERKRVLLFLIHELAWIYKITGPSLIPDEWVEFRFRTGRKEYTVRRHEYYGVGRRMVAEHMQIRGRKAKLDFQSFFVSKAIVLMIRPYGLHEFIEYLVIPAVEHNQRHE